MKLVDSILEWLKGAASFLAHSSEWILIISTLMLAFVTLLLFLHERRKRREGKNQARALVDICRIKDFDAGSIVGGYNASNVTEYLPIELDTEIQLALQNGNNIVLAGRPGIGKSHAAAHHLSAFENWFLLRPKRQAVQKPEIIRLKRRDYVLLLDDLHEYIDDIESLTGVLDLIDQVRAQSKRLLVVATIRTTLPEFETLQTETKLLGRWRYFELEDWTLDQGKELARRVGSDLSAWDQTPLSVKQPSVEMQLRYKLATSSAKRILRTIKLLKDVGIKPADRQLVRSVYISDIFAGRDVDFETSLEEIWGAGFLKKGTDQVEAYDPYVDGIKDWIPGPKASPILIELLVRQKRLDELLSMAGRWHSQGKLDEAEKTYNLCVQINPEDERASYRLGIMLARQSRWDDAAACFWKVTKIQPRKVGAWYRLSHILNRLGDDRQAKYAFQRARAIGANDIPLLRLRRAEELREEGQLEEALAEINALINEQGVTSQPTPTIQVLATAHFTLGRVLTELDRSKEAIEPFGEALRLNPDIAERHVGLGIALMKAKDNARAEAAFRKAIDLNRNIAAAHSYLGRVLTTLDRPKEAIVAFEEAIRLKPAVPDIHVGSGIALMKSGDKAGAEAAFRKAIDLNLNLASARSYLGRVLTALDRPKEAVDAFQEALRLKPDSSEILVGLGIALMKSGDKAGAEAVFRKAIALNPDLEMAYSYLGRVLTQLDRPKEAVDVFYESLRIKPDIPERHVGLGIALMKSGDKSGAEAAFRKALDLNPDLAIARSYLGKSLTDIDRSQEAVDTYQSAELTPDGYVGLGAALRKTGDYAGAEEAFRNAIRLSPKFARAHSYLGTLLGSQGRSTDAIEAHRTAIALEPQMWEGHFGLGDDLRRVGDSRGARRCLSRGDSSESAGCRSLLLSCNDPPREGSNARSSSDSGTGYQTKSGNG